MRCSPHGRTSAGCGLFSTEVLTPRRRFATHLQDESFTRRWQVWRDSRSTFACVLSHAPGVENMVEPRAAAFSRSLDMRGGRPSIWTIAYPDGPINRELENCSGSLLFKSHSAGAGGDAICSRSCTMEIRRLQWPSFAKLRCPLQRAYNQRRVVLLGSALLGGARLAR